MLDLAITRIPAALLGGAAPETLLTDLIAYYRFNGNGDDSSGNGRDLTVNSGNIVVGNINGALQEGFAEASVAIPTTGEVTISMWVNLGADVGDVALAGAIELIAVDSSRVVYLNQFSRNGSTSISRTGLDDEVNEVYPSSDFTFENILSNDQWLHVVSVLSPNGDLTTWVNGQYNSAVFTPVPFEISSIQVNSLPDAGSKIGDVGIWNRALTQAEVTQLYNSGNGLDPTS